MRGFCGNNATFGRHSRWRKIYFHRKIDAFLRWLNRCCHRGEMLELKIQSSRAISDFSLQFRRKTWNSIPGCRFQIIRYASRGLAGRTELQGFTKPRKIGCVDSPLTRGAFWQNSSRTCGIQCVMTISIAEPCSCLLTDFNGPSLRSPVVFLACSVRK